MLGTRDIVLGRLFGVAPNPFSARTIRGRILYPIWSPAPPLLLLVQINTRIIHGLNPWTSTKGSKQEDGMSEHKVRDRFRDRMATQLGDGPIEEEYRVMMNSVAIALNEMFNGKAKGKDRKNGIVLLVFPFGDVTGRCNFISNGADRKDIVTLFKEMIARFEGQPEIKGNA